MSAVYLEHRDAHHVDGARGDAEVDAAVLQAAQAIAAADALVFSAGAGMGVDSGLPDFRGTTGLWTARDVAMSYEDMSDDKWFEEDPLFAWGVNYTQMSMYRRTPPHAGYATLLKWATTLGKPYFVWTSNIDGMFEKAGFPSEKVTTCHGDMWHLQCTHDFRRCAAREEDRSDLVWSAAVIPEGLDECIDPATLRFRSAEPLEAAGFKCPRCGRLARPNVWFCHDKNYCCRNESSRIRDEYNKWLWDLQERKAKLVVVECGGGMAIPSVRIEGEDAVAGCGEASLLVRLNPSARDCRVPADRGCGLPLGSMEGLRRIDLALESLKAGTGARTVAPKAKAIARSGPAGAAGGVRKPSPARRSASPAGARKASPARSKAP